MKTKLYVVGSTAHSLINFRLELIKLLKKKYKVIVLAKDFDKTVEKKFKKVGIKSLSYGNKSSNEFLSFIKLKKILNEEKKVLIISYTLRANIFIGLLSLINKKIKHYPMITGLGGIFLSKNENFLRYLIFIIFRITLFIIMLRAKKIIFQNADDKKYLAINLLKKKSFTVPGSGVDCNFYKKLKLPKKITFMMISRNVKYKGVENFFNLSKYISKRYKNINFVYVGKSQNSFSLKKNFIKNESKLSKIKILKWKNNARSYYQKCSIYILPSKREGMSRSVMEAMASGRAIITTNVPGCKEMVKNDYNGYKIEYDDYKALISVAKKFILKPHLIKAFGINSRRIVINKFNIKQINGRILKNLE